MAQPGKLPVLQIRVSDRGDTFIETSSAFSPPEISLEIAPLSSDTVLSVQLQQVVGCVPTDGTK